MVETNGVEEELPDHFLILEATVYPDKLRTEFVSVASKVKV